MSLSAKERKLCEMLQDGLKLSEICGMLELEDDEVEGIVKEIADKRRRFFAS